MRNVWPSSMAEALVAGDLVESARCSAKLGAAKALDPAMCTPEMSRLESAMRSSGALGGKASGSGAGGCMFFLGPDDPRPAVAAARALGMRMLPVHWATEGGRTVLIAGELAARRAAASRSRPIWPHSRAGWPSGRPRSSRGGRRFRK